MDFGTLVLISTIVWVVIFLGIVWSNRDVESQRRQANPKLYQASWTSSAMQDEMGSGE